MVVAAELVVIAVGVLLGLVVAAWRLRSASRACGGCTGCTSGSDAARAGLDAALARRAAAAARGGRGRPPGAAGPRRRHGARRPAAAAGGLRSRRCPGRAARRGACCRAAACGSTREAAANALGRALARLDRAALPADVRAALVDAEQLLVLARRVHNDAVRDTLGLRSRRLVRWLRLAGTAPMPAYFEIADPAPTLTYDRVSPSQE